MVIQNQDGSRVELQKASDGDCSFNLINIQDTAKAFGTGSGQISGSNMNAEQEFSSKEQLVAHHLRKRQSRSKKCTLLIKGISKDTNQIKELEKKFPINTHVLEEYNRSPQKSHHPPLLDRSER